MAVHTALPHSHTQVLPFKESLLAMIGILEDNSKIQKLVPSGAKSRARTDPEYFITAQGPFIYYNRYQLATTDTGPGSGEADTTGAVSAIAYYALVPTVAATAAGSSSPALAIPAARVCTAA